MFVAMLDLRVVLAALTVALVSADALADLPPPEGETRVDYTFTIDAVPAGMTVIGFPSYNFKTPDTHVVLVQPGEEVRMFQGWTPGLYVVPSADAADVTGSDDAVKAYLAAKGKQCLTKVPRVFSVATTSGVEKMSDVIHLDASTSGCTATLARTRYEGPGGKGEGGVDASGKRTPPSPFGADLPDVRASGFVLATTPAPATPTSTPTPVATPASAPAPSTAPPASTSACSLRTDRNDGALTLLLTLLLGVTARPRRAWR